MKSVESFLDYQIVELEKRQDFFEFELGVINKKSKVSITQKWRIPDRRERHSGMS